MTTSPGQWLREQRRRIPRWAIRRAVRAAVATPLAFALASQVLPPEIALFTAFGTQLQILFVEFTGPQRHLRTVQFTMTTSTLVAVGTLLSPNTVVAAAGIAALAFCISFGGVVSPAITTLPRLAAWGIACAFVYLATTLVLPAPDVDPLRAATMDALDVLRRGTGTRPPVKGAASLRTELITMRYQPDALNRGQRQEVLLANRVVRLAEALSRETRSANASLDAAERDLIRVGVVDTQLVLAGDSGARKSLLDVRVELENRREGREIREAGAPSPAAWQAHLALQAASAVAESASVLDDSPRILPEDFWTLLRPQMHPSSPWLRGSVRIAVALGISIAVAHVFGTQHAFWVSFGTLTVLRTNALNTGQSAGRALVGTIVGAGVGEVLVLALPESLAAWVILPLALFITGLAPGFSAFGVGQGGFTVVILVLFDVSTPGSMLVAARIEDLLIGAAVSVIVALLAWPRGATAAFRVNLAAAYSRSADYLDDAIRFAMDPTAKEACLSSRRKLVAADYRAEQALRELLIERGSSLTSPSDVVTALSLSESYLDAADWIIDFADHRQQEHASTVDAGTARSLETQAAQVTARQRWIARGVLDGRQADPYLSLAPSPGAELRTTDALPEWISYQLNELWDLTRQQLPAVNALPR